MNKSRRAIEIIAVLLVVGFCAYQFFAGYYFSITTESAVFYEYSQGIEITGTVIRNENIITSTDSGTLHFVISDGERVAKGGVIAQVYSSDKASAAASRIDEINEQLSTIEEIEGYNDLNAVDMNTLNLRITDRLNQFIYCVSDNSFDTAQQKAAELVAALTRKQVATGQDTDFTALKKSLTDERTSLEAVKGKPQSVCTATCSGYFVSGTDGFENLYSTEDLSVYTPEYLSGIKPEATDNTQVGKIVHDYQWYVAAIIPISDSMFYKADDTVKLKIDAADQTVTAKVERINISAKSDSAVIILSCSQMDSKLATMRSGKMTIVKNEYSGLKVSSKAIRIVDSVTGVYVISGLEAKFVEAKVLYSNNEYVICELNTADDSKLRLYDEVIVKGRGLYDGKIIY